MKSNSLKNERLSLTQSVAILRERWINFNVLVEPLQTHVTLAEPPPSKFVILGWLSS